MRFFCASAALIGMFSTAFALRAQTVDPGRRVFESRCARCHGADGNGGERGPSITARLTMQDDQQLTGLIRDGLPARGMPASDVATTEMADLVKFLRTIQRQADSRGGRLRARSLLLEPVARIPCLQVLRSGCKCGLIREANGRGGLQN